MRQKIKFVLFALFFIKGATAQVEKKQATLPKTPTAFSNNTSLQLGVGTQGLSFDVKETVSSKFTLRLGTTLLPVHNLDLTNTVDIGIKSSTNGDADLNSVRLLLEYSPVHNGGFRLVTGAGYFYKSGLVMNLSINESKQFSNTGPTYTGAQIGTVKTVIDSKGIAPYIGIGLGRATRKHRFTTNLDLGTFILPSPTVVVTGTNMLSNNSHLGPVLQNQISDYKWLPVLQLHFNYRIN
ncbi:hypothetical protein [Parasediminibacterium sp. JCM 36343]|uniref:hypothetical protein n=1 Tax=Parasediminibacterium sp. JCM 36343 TaxID=3374279 RepID=UPI00397C2C54